jgi:hypothetical protein
MIYNLVPSLLSIFVNIDTMFVMHEMDVVQVSTCEELCVTYFLELFLRMHDLQFSTVFIVCHLC